MKVLFIALVITYILALMGRFIKAKNEKPSIYFTLIIIIILVLVSGLRNDIGDTPAYVHLYDLIGPGYDSGGGYEPGFILFLTILKKISTNPQFMIFVTSLIVNVFNIWTIRKYSKNNYFELSVFMYIASGYYLVTMNGIRQSLAAALLFAAVPLIIEGKFKKFLIIVLIMSSIHTSSLIMIPVYFIARTEAWSKNITKLLILTVIGVVLFTPLMQLVFKLLGDSKYAEYANFDEGGANIIRIIVFAVPVVLAYLKRDILKKKWPESDIFVNLSLMCFIIMVFSYFNWIFARFTITLQCYTFILLPYIIKNCLEKTEKRLVYYGFVACYLFFFYYEHGIALGLVYTTNYTTEKLFYNVIN